MAFLVNLILHLNTPFISSQVVSQTLNFIHYRSKSFWLLKWCLKEKSFGAWRIKPRTSFQRYLLNYQALQDDRFDTCVKYESQWVENAELLSMDPFAESASRPAFTMPKMKNSLQTYTNFFDICKHKISSFAYCCCEQLKRCPDEIFNLSGW